MRFRLFIGALCAALSLCAAAAIPASEQATAVEFYNATLDHYFISADPKEIADLDTGVHKGWARTGYQFAVIKAGSTYAGTSPVCRFYSTDPAIDSHFYSAKPSECDDVKTKWPKAWQFESAEVFRAFLVDPQTGVCPADTTATYRLYNERADTNHRYSDQLAVYNYMVSEKGYEPEGDGSPSLPIIFCTPAGGDTVPAAAAAAPNCTVTASSASPAPGSTLALAATCTNNPTAYLWVGCSSNAATCNATKSTAGTASYTLNAANTVGPGDPVTINVNWGGSSGGGAVPICSVSADTTSPVNGGTLTLSANCSQSPSKYTYQECNFLVQQVCTPIAACASATTSCQITSAIPGYARYTVNATNGAGTGANATPVDVFWSSGGGGGGGGNPPPTDPIPVCSVLTSNLNPQVGANIVLSASCSGNPTQFSWSGVSCSQVQCQATSSQPGPVTYSVAGSNATGTGSTASVTVNWQAAGGGAPSCSVTSSSTTPEVNSPITLTAACSNAPTGYAWTGCSSTTSTCSPTPATVAGTQTYSVVATNAAGASPSSSVSVDWQPPATSAPVCSIGASTLTPTVGQPLSLTATCSGSPTSFAWTNCSSTGPTCTATATAAGSMTYYVSATNQYGTSASAPSVTVTWQASNPGGGGGGGGAMCSQYSKVEQFTIPWGDTSRYKTADYGGFGSDTVVVAQFTVPSSPSSYATAGKSAWAEYGAAPAYRILTLSTQACDFRDPDGTGANGPLAAAAGTAPLVNFNVGGPAGSGNDTTYALQPGQTYYLNIRNLNCPVGGSCEASTSVSWPQ